MYLTYDEYTDLGFSKVSKEGEFEKLEKYAERHLNLVTQDYYMLHSLKDDTNNYRVTKFKLAMAIQVDYLETLGGNVTLSEMLSDSPSSVSIGRTRIENKSAGMIATVGRTMCSAEAYAELTYTGLLYKGVAYQ
ncbi:hypothetical protein C7H83_06745 [Tetragenococcus halophilus]|uniref:Uncharacterized protein n=1 Tax=Tetragenococcus halophilus TaxID=51669 RepID=A0A3G5FIJ4_TETHA|nr:hypothetical protein [Tetragenococcus halophilus]AYW50177.1 hypothetical protein C7H83_06745 [Tetragenococcus halophilus]GBD63772.1 hypothetical protein TEHD23766T_1199 [Tetragenococcus halophilus subsp. flandriensis]